MESEPFLWTVHIEGQYDNGLKSLAPKTSAGLRVTFHLAPKAGTALLYWLSLQLHASAMRPPRAGRAGTDVRG